MKPSPVDAVLRGYATVAQMSARLEVFALQAGARVEDVEADFGKLRIRARRYSERMRDGSLRHVVQLFKGHDPLNVIEDLAEDAWVRALEQKLVTPEQLIGWVREAEAATGNAYLERGYAHDAAEPMKLLEALSAISREYALDRIHAGEGFPARLKEWLDLIVGMTAAVFSTAREVALRLGRGAELRRAFEGGALPAEFLAQVEDSIGLNAEARERRLREGGGNYEEGSTSGEVEAEVFADLSPDTTFSIGPMTDPAERVREVLEGPALAGVAMDTIKAREGERASDAARRWLAGNPQDDLARAGLGPVIFDGRSIKATLGHGFSGPKLNALAAVPEMIAEGALIDVSMDYDGKPIRNWIIAGPIQLGDRRQILFVRLRAEVSPKSGEEGLPRFYVHEVALEERLYEKIESDSLKTGAASGKEVGRDGGIELYLSIARKAIEVNREDPMSGDAGLSMSLAPLGPGPRKIREAPRLLERKENPFSNSAAKTPKEWRAEWSGWIKAHRKEWEGEGPVELPEGPVVIGGKARDHIKDLAQGERPALHFEAAVRMRELLENSVVATVEMPRGYEKGAVEIHRRYAWMAFADGQARHVLLTVKRWQESSNVDTDSLYALEALEVREPGVLPVEGNSFPKDHPSISPDSGGSLARFLAGIKPEHRWMSGADDAGAGRTFSLGDPRSWGDTSDSRGRGTGSDPSGRKGGKRIENPNSDDKRLSDQTGPDSRREGIRGSTKGGKLQAAIDDLGRIAAADAAGVPGGSAEDFGRREAREWAVVARAAEAASGSERFVLNPALVFAEGGESRIEAWSEGLLLKHLKQAGFVFDLGKSALGREVLVLRPALPSELLERFGITNRLFGDIVTVEGFTTGEDGRATYVISQEAIMGGEPSQEEIDAALTAAGFRQVPDDGRIADFHLSHRTWIEPQLRLLITDAKPPNFKKDPEGVIYPIDLIAQKVRDPKMWEILTR